MQPTSSGYCGINKIMYAKCLAHNLVHDKIYVIGSYP